MTPKLSRFCHKPTQCIKGHTVRTSAIDREKIIYVIQNSLKIEKELRIKRKSNIKHRLTKSDSHNQTLSCNDEKPFCRLKMRISKIQSLAKNAQHFIVTISHVYCTKLFNRKICDLSQLGICCLINN